ncbi:hypothetical protein [Ligaoa zhengdingensis]|uniref:hypothetical protein n=1 Tax=Ligaoa zhengdingensis TaxID=2763658 RepID=UPI0031BAE006
MEDKILNKFQLFFADNRGTSTRKDFAAFWKCRFWGQWLRRCGKLSGRDDGEGAPALYSAKRPAKKVEVACGRKEADEN